MRVIFRMSYFIHPFNKYCSSGYDQNVPDKGLRRCQGAKAFLVTYKGVVTHSESTNTQCGHWWQGS